MEVNLIDCSKLPEFSPKGEPDGKNGAKIKLARNFGNLNLKRGKIL